MSTSLTDLGKLIESWDAKARAHQALVYDPKAPLSQNIYRLMSDYRGRTIAEVASELKAVEPSEEVIKNAVVLLNNAGWFTFSKPSAQSGIVYALKRNLSAQVIERGTMKKQHTVKTFQAPVVAEHDPVGIVKLSEGLDVAIWKISCDRKQRTVTEMGELLAAFGFDRVQAKDRVIVLANKGWFIRQPHRGVTHYTLKKGWPMPKLPGQEKVEQPALALVKAKPAATPVEKVAQAVAAQVTTSAPVQKKAEPKPMRTTPAILASDTLPIKIWKTVSDHQEYTSADMILLLSDYATRTPIYQAMSDLNFIHGWFDVRTDRNKQVYRLKEGVPQPDHSFKQKKPAGATNNQPIQQEIATMSQPVKQVVTPAAPAATPLVCPLIEVVVRIKGMDFTFAEAREVYKALSAQNYGYGKKPQAANALISTNISIKGQTFVPEELENIARVLLTSGLNT